MNRDSKDEFAERLLDWKCGKWEKGRQAGNSRQAESWRAPGGGSTQRWHEVRMGEWRLTRCDM